MNYKKTIVCFMITSVMILSACGSDYPVMDRELDVKELIVKCFEGTGLEVNIEEGNVIVNCVADQMEIDMSASDKEIKKIQTAIRNATVTGDGLSGVWNGTLDISPVICEVFSDVEGLNLENYLQGTYIPASLIFTESGSYMLKFDASALEKSNDDILKKTSKAAKTYFENTATGAGKVVAGALPSSSIEAVIKYAIKMADEMLVNGASGYYSAKNGIITFDGADSCSYILNENILQISDCNMRGVLSSLGAAESETFTKG